MKNSTSGLGNTNMDAVDRTFAEPKSFEEAIELINSSPTLRKLKSAIDGSNMSADLKAIIYDIAKVTIKIGEAVIAIGRRIIEIAISMVRKFPNMTIGVLVGLVVGTLVAGPLGAITILGKPIFAGLAALLSKLIMLLSVGKGFIDDLRENAAKAEMDRVAAQFNAFSMGVVQS